MSQKNLGENLPGSNGRVSDAAGKALKVSGKSIDHAAKVLEKPKTGRIKPRRDPSALVRRDPVRSFLSRNSVLLGNYFSRLPRP
jgi:hypothetical protein